MPPNFQNGKIYSICSHQTDKIYIGSTTRPLNIRFIGHKQNSNPCSSSDIMKFEDAYIQLIEYYPCANKTELNRREGEIIKINNYVNKNIAGRTFIEYKKQYLEDNKEQIKEKMKQYKNMHKDRLKKYKIQYNYTHKEEAKQYHDTNKKMRKCSCGVEYNDGKTYNRNTHYSSKFHVKFVNDFYDRLHKLLVPDAV